MTPDTWTNMTHQIDHHLTQVPASITTLTNSSQKLPVVIAMAISLLAVIASFWLSENIYERLPHVEDEFAYVWQAQVFARGQAYLPSPPHPEQLVVPFVVDYHGLRFSKYPPGWSLLLALGVLTGTLSWVNPILAGLGTWLTFRLGQKIFDNFTALLAIGLMATSPFFLINSGTLLSHPWSLVLCLSLTIAWLDLFFETDNRLLSKTTVPTWIKIWVAGLSLGVLALTRPVTAIGVAIPFFIHGLILLWRGTHATRKQILFVGLIAGGVGGILLVWQYLTTGDPFQNSYTLWWTYDKIGFGSDVGTQPGGHNFFWVINNLILSLLSGSSDLFGWTYISWFFIPIGLWASRYNKSIKLIIGVPIGLALAYSIYWISPNLYGPRYYYEVITSASLLTAAGITWLINWHKENAHARVWQATVLSLVFLLIGYNFILYTPVRFDTMRNLYKINREQQALFLTDSALSLTPALVVVHTHEWTDCAGLLPLQDPWLTTPFIFACDMDNPPAQIEQSEYPDRTILHYYPEEKELFTSQQK